MALEDPADGQVAAPHGGEAAQEGGDLGVPERRFGDEAVAAQRVEGGAGEAAVPVALGRLPAKRFVQRRESFKPHASPLLLAR